ncbi:hypothetical protein ACEZCY_14565 [Streptacidiphilus sp. N1-12]|uniref:DUF4375 domain-containing protein n=2 Tax=Streptacidiphilus alkalitolerans TaxID=3342712 RepID=A0ABV6WEJ3_9ACTN
MLNPDLAQQILDRVTADPAAYDPAMSGFVSSLGYAVWPEDTVTGDEITMGTAAWACYLAGWHLTIDSMGDFYAFPEHGSDDHRDLDDLAADLLGLDGPELLEETDRDAALAGLRALTASPGSEPANKDLSMLGSVSSGVLGLGALAALGGNSQAVIQARAAAQQAEIEAAAARGPAVAAHDDSHAVIGFDGAFDNPRFQVVQMTFTADNTRFVQAIRQITDALQAASIGLLGILRPFQESAAAFLAYYARQAAPRPKRTYRRIVRTSHPPRRREPRAAPSALNAAYTRRYNHRKGRRT